MEDIKDSWFDISFLVVDDKTMRYDIIIGREFINNSNLKLIYSKGAFIFELVDNLAEIASDILTINAIEYKEPYDTVMENLDMSLSLQDCREVLSTFIEVDTLEIERVNDNYKIEVHLKDNSLFRYAPRRMSFAEREELQNIIDDLLKRDIIKPSISPYCSRVILS